jgi:hypothetical protein
VRRAEQKRAARSYFFSAPFLLLHNLYNATPHAQLRRKGNPHLGYRLNPGLCPRLVKNRHKRPITSQSEHVFVRAKFLDPESTGVYWIPLFQILEARGFKAPRAWAGAGQVETGRGRGRGRRIFPERYYPVKGNGALR